MSLFSSDVPVAGPYAPSCSSRTADGALRGVLVGWCWTAAFAAKRAPGDAMDGRREAAVARGLTLKNSAGFALSWARSLPRRAFAAYAPAARLEQGVRRRRRRRRRRRAGAAVVASRHDVGGLDGGGRGRRVLWRRDARRRGARGVGGLLARHDHGGGGAVRPGASTQTTTKTTMPTSGLP